MTNEKNEIKCFNCTKKRNKTDDYLNCRLKCNYKYKKEQESDRKEITYLKECCINAGKELSKHSFKWDGKEKNLVVQALYLNGKYEKLESALKEIEAELENDLTCESRECGCDDYSECLQCLKETILNIVNEVQQ